MNVQIEYGYIGYISKFPNIQGDDVLWLKYHEEYYISKYSTANIKINIQSSWNVNVFQTYLLLTGDGSIIVNNKEYHNSIQICNNDIFKIEDFMFQFQLKIKPIQPPSLEHPNLLLFDLKQSFPSVQQLNKINTNELLKSIQQKISPESKEGIQIVQRLLKNIYEGTVDYNSLRERKDKIDQQVLKRMDSLTLLNINVNENNTNTTHLNNNLNDNQIQTTKCTIESHESYKSTDNNSSESNEFKNEFKEQLHNKYNNLNNTSSNSELNQMSNGYLTAVILPDEQSSKTKKRKNETKDLKDLKLQNEKKKEESKPSKSKKSKQSHHHEKKRKGTIGFNPLFKGDGLNNQIDIKENKDQKEIKEKRDYKDHKEMKENHHDKETYSFKPKLYRTNELRMMKQTKQMEIEPMNTNNLNNTSVSNNSSIVDQHNQEQSHDDTLLSFNKNETNNENNANIDTNLQHTNTMDIINDVFGEMDEEIEEEKEIKENNTVNNNVNNDTNNNNITNNNQKENSVDDTEIMEVLKLFDFE